MVKAVVPVRPDVLISSSVADAPRRESIAIESRSARSAEPAQSRGSGQLRHRQGHRGRPDIGEAQPPTSSKPSPERIEARNRRARSPAHGGPEGSGSRTVRRSPRRPRSIRSTSPRRCGWPTWRTRRSRPPGRRSSRPWPSSPAPGLAPALAQRRDRTTTSTPATSSDRRGESSTSPSNRSTSAAVRGPSRPNPIGVPMINIFGPMTEVWFEPLAARRRVDQTRFTAQATSNDILLDVSLLHLELLANEAILEADRLTESQVYQVADRHERFRDRGRRAKGGRRPGPGRVEAAPRGRPACRGSRRRRGRPALRPAQPRSFRPTASRGRAAGPDQPDRPRHARRAT